MDLNLQPASSTTILMMTFDEVSFQVDVEVAKEMEILRSFIEEHDRQDLNMIPLPNVSSGSLTKIVDYITTHLEFKEKAKKWYKNEKINVLGRDKYDKFTMEASAYDNQYLGNLDNDAIKELVLAANYLNVKDLLILLNKEIANRIKKKSVEYVRKLLEIENDYTPEEEQAIHQENPWAWEDIDED